MKAVYRRLWSYALETIVFRKTPHNTSLSQVAVMDNSRYSQELIQKLAQSMQKRMSHGLSFQQLQDTVVIPKSTRLLMFVVELDSKDLHLRQNLIIEPWSINHCKVLRRLVHTSLLKAVSFRSSQICSLISNE